MKQRTDYKSDNGHVVSVEPDTQPGSRTEVWLVVFNHRLIIGEFYDERLARFVGCTLTKALNGVPQGYRIADTLTLALSKLPVEDPVDASRDDFGQNLRLHEGQRVLGCGACDKVSRHHDKGEHGTVCAVHDFGPSGHPGLKPREWSAK